MAVLSLSAAQALLEQYSCLESRALPTPAARTELQTALRQVVAASDRQIFGICADSFSLGVMALQSYLDTLSVPVTTLDNLGVAEPERLAGPIYIKFNSSNGRCFWEAYTGTFRGVLVSCQSDFDDGVNGTYGHLPLDLFAVP